MTNLEICKRIAELEGIHVSNANAGMYDPIEDKDLCFDLMEQWIKEFDIDVHRAYTAHPCTYAVDTGFSVIFNDSVSKALCLARIAIYERWGK